MSATPWPIGLGCADKPEEKKMDDDSRCIPSEVIGYTQNVFNAPSRIGGMTQLVRS